MILSDLLPTAFDQQELAFLAEQTGSLAEQAGHLQNRKSQSTRPRRRWTRVAQQIEASSMYTQPFDRKIVREEKRSSLRS